MQPMAALKCEVILSRRRRDPRASVVLAAGLRRSPASIRPSVLKCTLGARRCSSAEELFGPRSRVDATGAVASRLSDEVDCVSSTVSGRPGRCCRLLHADKRVSVGETAGRRDAECFGDLHLLWTRARCRALCPQLEALKTLRVAVSRTETTLSADN